MTDNKGQNLITLKGHKLTSALYLVTEFLADQDPLKWRLRQAALDLLNVLIDGENGLSESRRLGTIEQAVGLINKISALADIALTGRAASEMNFSILKKEYLDLRTRLLLERDNLQPQLYAVPELAALAEAPISSPRPATLPPRVSKGQNSTPTRREESNPRRDSILSAIKKQGWSSIKDIAQAVPEVSSKTVQRELADLVQAGILKKEGDRRWSRYHLATN